MTADDPATETSTDLRETSGATTALVVGYVRMQAGDAAVEELLRRAGVDRPVADLEDESVWCSYDERIRLFRAAIEVLGDPDAMFDVGATSLRNRFNASMILMLRALGSPRQVFRQLPRAVPKFTTTSSMEILESGATHATIRYTLHEGYEHSRLDCRYAQGLFAVVPELFGLPQAQIVHDECQSDGHAACTYHVTWTRRSRPWRRSAELKGADAQEIAALRKQLQELQNAASALVSSEDAGEVLAHITERAAAAVLAQGYLLAVDGPDGEPLVRHAGVDPARAARLAEALRRGEDLGPSAVVVDVTSTRRHHGRLAAIYADGQRGLASESSLLRAYAGHAAAALDLVLALDKSRRDQRTAQSLLALARDLARARTPDAVAGVAASAMPAIADVARASVFLFDPERDALVPTAATGMTVDEERGFYAHAVDVESFPELRRLLHRPRAVVLRRGEAGPRIERLLSASGAGATVLAPLVADGEVLGVLTAGWRDAVSVEAEEAAMVPVIGVADQTAVALQNARLVARIRHQTLHDALTGLPNRVQFAERLDAALAAAEQRETAVGVLFCDLDGFKGVNDTLGHAAGDDLLRQVARRLRGSVRANDLVARLAGDEFAVLLPGIPAREAARRVGDAIVACFDEPFEIAGAPLRITTSVGVAVGLGGALPAEALVQHADAAMYAAKHGGRARVRTSWDEDAGVPPAASGAAPVL